MEETRGAMHPSRGRGRIFSWAFQFGEILDLSDRREAKYGQDVRGRCRGEN